MKLLGILAQAHAGLFHAKRIHLPQQDILLGCVERVAPVLLGAVTLAERQLQRVAGSILRDVVVGIDVESVIVFVREDEGSEDGVHIKICVHIEVELTVFLHHDLITEGKIPRGEMSRRGDFHAIQQLQ